VQSHNRSIVSVVFGGVGAETGAPSEASAAASKGVKAASVEDASFMLENASKVMIIPGYGMAVSQAPARGEGAYER